MNELNDGDDKSDDEKKEKEGDGDGRESCVCECCDYRDRLMDLNLTEQFVNTDSYYW